MKRYYFLIFFSFFIVLNAETTTQMTDSNIAATANTTSTTQKSINSLKELNEKAGLAGELVDSRNISYVGWITAAAVATGLAAVFAGIVVVKQYRVIQAAKLLSVSQDELGKEKDRLASVEIAGANKAASEADEKAATAQQETAKLQVRSAALEKDVADAQLKIAEAQKAAAKANLEAEQLRLEMAKIDPMNRPIKSIRVEMSLLVVGEFIFTGSSVGGAGVKTFDNFTIFDDSGALVMVQCTQSEMYPVTTTVGNESAPVSPNAKSFTLSFSWPGTSFFERVGADNPDLRFRIEKNNTTPAEFDKTVRNARFVLSGLKSAERVEQGLCIVTLNGSIQRRFSVPKTLKVEEQLGQLFFTPEPISK